MQHTVEKIGGTSMSNYEAVRDNVVLGPGYADNPYNRIFVVSAYGGMTDLLLSHKKTGEPGVYALFANADERSDWLVGLDRVSARIREINEGLFSDDVLLQRSMSFITTRLKDAERCLADLQSVCRHGHFALGSYLNTVKEMLASLGEAHSAWNMTHLLREEGIDARFVDLTGWNSAKQHSLDEAIRNAFAGIDLRRELPIVTGYAHCEAGLMRTFHRGYSEMTFSRIAVLTGAREAVIHKEYHLSSADPRLVGVDQVVPIGRTNYDVADQLANLGMEAIHPQAAKGLRASNIPLRVKNCFEPEHDGTLVTPDYVSENPCVEIIAGRRNIYALECLDPDMSGVLADYDRTIIDEIRRFKAPVVSKDVNANTVTHFLATNLKTVQRIRAAVAEHYPEAQLQVRKVAIVSAIGSDLNVAGLLAKSVDALARAGVGILAMHQSMRQVDMQFVIDEEQYEHAVRALHQRLVEAHDHGDAICAA